MTNESNDLLHSTFSISKGLPSEIVINYSKGSWVQTLDYEGIPFRCQRCFKIGHATKRYGHEKKTVSALQWKGALNQHDMVVKKIDFHEVPNAEGPVTIVSSSVVLDSCGGASEASQSPPLLPVDPSFGAPLPGGFGATISSSIHVVTFFGGTSCASEKVDAIGSFTQSLIVSSLGSSDWTDATARVEEGWITVKGMKSKISTPSFDMTL